MKLETIQCTVRINVEGKFGMTEIVCAGPDALSATEIPLLRMRHDVANGLVKDECSIHNAVVVGETETDKATEFQRLIEKYGDQLVKAAYPQGRGMPLTLADCELPDGCFAPKRAAPKKPAPEVVEDIQVDTRSPQEIAAAKKAVRAALNEAGVEIPPGNLTESDLLALADEHGVEPLETA